MEPVTIAALGCAGIAVIIAGISSERARVWKQKALTASRFHMDAIVETGEYRDKAEALQRAINDLEHGRFIDRETFERKWLDQAIKLSKATTELAAIKAKNGQRTAAGNRTRKLNRLAKQAATTQALRECVEARG